MNAEVKKLANKPTFGLLLDRIDSMSLFFLPLKIIMVVKHLNSSKFEEDFCNLKGQYASLNTQKSILTSLMRQSAACETKNGSPTNSKSIITNETFWNWK